MEREELTEIPGADGWSYGAFEQDTDDGSTTIPLHREDGKSAAFTLPDFVSDPEDLRSIAAIVIGALEKWEKVKGLGA